MSRLEFEARLIEDGALRKELAELEIAGRRVKDLEADVREARTRMHECIYSLRTDYGVPAAFLARQVGLTPQRMGTILQEQETKPR